MRNTSFGQSGKSIFDYIIEQVRLKKVIKDIPINSTVLDLGCGYSGSFLKILSPRINKGFGVDLQITKSNIPKNIQLLKGSIEKPLPFKNNGFNVITLIALAEHLQNPILVYKLAFQLLKPKSLFLITTPSQKAKPILEFMAFRLHLISQDEISDHKRYYTKSTITDDLVKAGFYRDNISVTTFEFGMNLYIKACK